MPAITYDQFLTTSTLALQGGEGAAASGVHRDWVKQLLPSALNKLAEDVAEDPAKRLLLLVLIVEIGAEFVRLQVLAQQSRASRSVKTPGLPFSRRLRR